MSSVLLYEQDDLGVVTLTLNHPETRNALTGTGIVEAMLDACHRIECDSSVRAVVITATGTIFSSLHRLSFPVLRRLICLCI